jgi:hypothetical protein
VALSPSARQHVPINDLGTLPNVSPKALILRIAETKLSIEYNNNRNSCSVKFRRALKRRKCFFGRTPNPSSFGSDHLNEIRSNTIFRLQRYCSSRIIGDFQNECIVPKSGQYRNVSLVCEFGVRYNSLT